ncbi:MAG: hypothetical protein KBF98_06680 [Rhodoferax sp.]|nr:hypothetical protein [Rhodoferax sp.]MBP9685316.1 hypothetical protein [Rhodoferax sp.]
MAERALRGEQAHVFLETVGFSGFKTVISYCQLRATELALQSKLRHQIEANRHALYHDRCPIKAMEKLFVDALAK